MIVIIFKTGERMEIPEAVDIARRGGVLVVRDWEGMELAAFRQEDLESFNIETPPTPQKEAPPKRRYTRRESPRRSR